MASINGDWFHSRSSSNLEELLAVRTLVFESQKPEYIGFGWSGGREGNQRMYQFAAAANIQPSTMQTKIRAMIRYGFIKDRNQCPLIWTRMGSLWNDLYTIGNYNAGKLFVDAAHIKPDNIPDGEIPHRAHILNGLCLCKHCHIVFNKSYFSLTDDH